MCVYVLLMIFSIAFQTTTLQNLENLDVYIFFKSWENYLDYTAVDYVNMSLI